MFSMFLFSFFQQKNKKQVKDIIYDRCLFCYQKPRPRHYVTSILRDSQVCRFFLFSMSTEWRERDEESVQSFGKGKATLDVVRLINLPNEQIKMLWEDYVITRRYLLSTRRFDS